MAKKDEGVDAWGFRDEDYGGSHSNGTGTYEARTPAQARALYEQLPRGSRAEADRLVRDRKKR
jgi:hypothetical protein